MNEILPRLGSQLAKERRIVLAGGAKHPLRGVHSVIPRTGGGIPARVILGNSIIKGNGLVRVKAYNPEAENRGIDDAARRKALQEAEEKRRAAIKAETEKRVASLKREAKPIVESSKPTETKYITGHGYRLEELPEDELKEESVGITETESRLADFLEAAQEMKPLADEVIEETKSEETSLVGIDESEDQGLNIPEHTMGTEPVTSKPHSGRGRKKKRNRKAFDVSDGGML